MTHYYFFWQQAVLTKDGLPFQRWDSQEPHTHERPPLFFPELQDAENYCRNAGGEEHIPWCFTTNASIRWQHCTIPSCDRSYGSVGKTSDSVVVVMDQLLSPTFLIIISGIDLLMIIITLSLAWHKLITNSRRRRRPTKTSPRQSKKRFLRRNPYYSVPVPTNTYFFKRKSNQKIIAFNCSISFVRRKIKLHINKLRNEHALLSRLIVYTHITTI